MAILVDNASSCTTKWLLPPLLLVICPGTKHGCFVWSSAQAANLGPLSRLAAPDGGLYVGDGVTSYSTAAQCQKWDGCDWRRSHWNAEVSTKNFWWMYIKAAGRGTMSKCGCLTLGWTPGAGGKKVANCWTKSCEAKNDLLPHCLFAVSPGAISARHKATPHC